MADAIKSKSPPYNKPPGREKRAFPSHGPSSSNRDKSRAFGGPPSSSRDKPGSFGGPSSPNRDKPSSYRGNVGKRSRNFNRGPRNGNRSPTNGESAGPPVDLSDIKLTEEEKKQLGLQRLRSKDIPSLSRLALKLKIENPWSMKRQDIVFEILKRAGQLGDILGNGVLEVLSEGYGFLRSPDYNYLPAVDDIYVSHSQIRKWGLKSGDSISGTIRPPKEGEKYFALLKIEQLNFNPPEKNREKNLFDNLTPLYPQEKFRLEHDPKEITTRVVDLMAPLGKGQRGLIVAPPAPAKPFFCKTSQTPFRPITLRWF